jgi:hypothetical protein
MMQLDMVSPLYSHDRHVLPAPYRLRPVLDLSLCGSGHRSHMVDVRVRVHPALPLPPTVVGSAQGEGVGEEDKEGRTGRGQDEETGGGEAGERESGRT